MTSPSVDPAPEIRTEGLRKSFDEHLVLDGITLEIPRGDVVAIVGNSGCGKTVLLELMIGALDPDEGRVLVADHEAEGAPLRDLSALTEAGMEAIRVHWAVVFQRNALFSGSVYDNIALWLKEIKGLGDDGIVSIARASLAAVGFDEPDEIFDRDRDELSGGMAKRVAIARAIAMDPMIIFYDEPTTGLDPSHAAQIHELISAAHHTERDTRTPRTTIIVTHDKDLLRRLRPRIIMIHQGCVFFDGPFDEFEASRSPIIRPYFDLMPVLQRRSLLH